MTDFIDISIVIKSTKKHPTPHHYQDEIVLFTDIDDWKTGHIFADVWLKPKRAKSEYSRNVYFKVPKDTTEIEFKCKNITKNLWFTIKEYPINEWGNNIFKITQLKGYNFSWHQLQSLYYSKTYDNEKLREKEQLQEEIKKLQEKFQEEIKKLEENKLKFF